MLVKIEMAGHLARMEEGRRAIKIITGKPIGKRRFHSGYMPAHLNPDQDCRYKLVATKCGHDAGVAPVHAPGD